MAKKTITMLNKLQSKNNFTRSVGKDLILFLSLIFFLSQGVLAQDTPQQPTPKATATKKAMKYRLTIEFISKGNGIDGESFDKIENFIKNYAKKPVYEVKQKGREGEKTITSMLKELTKEEQLAFVMEIKKLIVKADLVLVKEYPAQKKFIATAIPVSNSNLCRLVVSFISRGEGIDIKSQEKIKAFIENHPKKPAFEEYRWGREGEIDYVLMLKEFSADEQKVFVKDVKKLIINKEMALIDENSDYVKKGR